jgi:hypothetical protein
VPPLVVGLIGVNEANVGVNHDAVRGVGVDARGVDDERVVEGDIPDLVVGHEPLTSVAGGKDVGVGVDDASLHLIGYYQHRAEHEVC